MPDSTRLWYDRLAPRYDRRWARYIKETVRETVADLDPKPGELILDLATGTGEVGRRLTEKRPDLTVIGLDLSAKMLARGRSKRADPSQARLVQSRAEALPFGDETFDRVLCASGFHHFDRPLAALLEIHRVLKPAGACTLVDWCDDYLSCRLWSLCLCAFDPSHHQTYSIEECEKMIISSHFKIKNIRRFKIDWLWGLMRFDALKIL